MENKLTRNKIRYVNLALSFFVVFHHAYNVNVYELSGGLLYILEKYLTSFFEISVPLF